MARHVIIDTDPGIDDALALILALQSPELCVEAITTVSGNVAVEPATRNALTVLGLFPSERRPPVARGAAQPLARPFSKATDFHGEDGLAGISGLRLPAGQRRYPPADASLSPYDAVTCLLNCIQQMPDALTLIALGPLTNLARAWQRDAQVVGRLAQVVIMGGAVAVPGNVTPVAEFNLYVDPEAAQVVFASGLPITLIGLDVTEQVRLTAQMLAHRIAPMTSPLSQFVMQCTSPALQSNSQVKDRAGMAMHDPLAVGVVIDPSLVRTVPLAVQVETQGEFTTGMLVAERRPLPSDAIPAANVRVALEVESARFLELFIGRLHP